MIGYRYKCTMCWNPKSGKGTVTFQSWDTQILDSLLKELGLEFPAILTHWSGISKKVYTFMRSCFQHGLGAKQFSSALRALQLEHYDITHLQYLHFVARGSQLNIWRGKIYEPFLPFDNTSPSGFHGYIPSSRLLRDIYDSCMEVHYADINQQVSLLTAEVCALDHSHKVRFVYFNIYGI
jgi:hypothetical protein